jgi:hypothetical protein
MLLVPLLFALLAIGGFLGGGVLTYFDATEPPKGRRSLRPVPSPARPATAPGTHKAPSPKPTKLRALVERQAPLRAVATPPPPKARVVAIDARLQPVLVGMGFRVPEARDAVSKLPASLAEAPFQDQVKAALALLAK